MNLPFIDNRYVQPATSNAGVSAGAAMYVSSGRGFRVIPVESALLGMCYFDDEIEKVLNDVNIPFIKINNPAATVAELLEIFD